MPADLDDVINKLSDPGVQDRFRSAVRAAAIGALAEEGIVLTADDWGALIAMFIAAKNSPEKPRINWGNLFNSLGPPLPILASLF